MEFMHNLAESKTTFLQDIPFISISFIITSKCRILQRGKRLFCKIFHVLVYVSILILINAKSCKKENDSLRAGSRLGFMREMRDASGEAARSRLSFGFYARDARREWRSRESVGRGGRGWAKREPAPITVNFSFPLCLSEV